MPTAPEPSSGLKLEDILFTLFRHKGKIILCFILGLAVAVGLFYLTPTTYESTAKLLVRYVVDGSGLDSIGTEGNVRRPDTRGDTIIASEIEILKSWDLLESVARAIGPDRILGVPDTNNLAEPPNAASPGNPATPPAQPQAILLSEATRQIALNLGVSAPNKGSVLVVSYRNPNPAVAQAALGELVKRYLEKHHAVHRAAGTYDFLQRQTDQLRSRLNQTEAELLTLKNQVKIENVSQARTENNALLSRLTQSIRDAETELAGYQARLEEIHRLSGSLPANLGSNLPPVDPAILQQYKTLNERLLNWRAQEAALFNQGFTESHPPTRQVIQTIAGIEQQKLQLETNHPGLLARMPTATENPRDAAPDPTPERIQIAASQARIAVLKSQVEAAEARANAIESVEAQITQLERRRELERTNYIYFSESLERARVDSSIDPRQIPNISPVQEPSAPMRVSREMPKKMAMSVFGAIALGIGIAFLFDLILDPSIKRPLEIEARLRIPLMLTIPLVARNGAHRRFLGGIWPKHSRKRRRRLLADYRPAPPPPRPERAPWEISHFVRPFCDALRDRLILLFQLKEMTHKPKLVALTSCSEGAGVTTMAAGLAASLSETGAGKVLLVDMNFNQPKAQSFLRGAFAPSLSNVILPGDNNNNGAVRSDNLYLATGTDAGAKAGALIPKQFYDLMPRLKASDFDYIIFDLPPMTQTSSTMALAPFMDQVILVIEADQDSRDQVKRAHAVLSNSRANVVGVFNKNRTRMPGWLQQDL